MLLLMVVALAFVTGVKGDRGCGDIEFKCSTESSFQELVARAYEQTGGIFLSNEFFQENCNSMLEYWECLQDFSDMCRIDLMLDLNILTNYSTEFCNEDSDLRKAYVANFVCLNGMNLTSQACFISTQRKMVELVPDIIEILKTSSLKTNCLFFYAVEPCVFGVTMDSCGEDAGAAVGKFINRIMDIHMCDPDDTVIFEDLLSRVH